MHISSTSMPSAHWWFLKGAWLCWPIKRLKLTWPKNVDIHTEWSTWELDSMESNLCRWPTFPPWKCNSGKLVSRIEGYQYRYKLLVILFFFHKRENLNSSLLNRVTWKTWQLLSRIFSGNLREESTWLVNKRKVNQPCAGRAQWSV